MDVNGNACCQLGVLLGTSTERQLSLGPKHHATYLHCTALPQIASLILRARNLLSHFVHVGEASNGGILHVDHNGKRHPTGCQHIPAERPANGWGTQVRRTASAWDIYETDLDSQVERLDKLRRRPWKASYRRQQRAAEALRCAVPAQLAGLSTSGAYTSGLRRTCRRHP